MTVNDWIHVLAGLFIVVSLALGWFVSPWFFLFTAFVGVNLFQYGFTRFCPMALILKKLGVPDAPRPRQETRDRSGEENV